METGQFVLYVIWFLIPTFFFLIALWGKLEEISDKTKKHNPSDFINQGIFVLLCVGVAIVIDQYLLPDFITPSLPDWIPVGFVQILLLPLVLLVASKIVGPSSNIRIERAPGKPGSKPKKR